MKTIVSSLEPLEPRIAPAVIVNALNPKIATYTDVDGDFITIKVSAGTLTPGLFTTIPINGHDQLSKIDFSAGGFDGVNLAIIVKKASTGDGLANTKFNP